MKDRISWDFYFSKIAVTVAERGTCDRAWVGAVLVNEDNQIISTGYNGSAKGLPHCSDVGHLMIDSHCIRTVHAESNAIIQAALNGKSTKGSTCYVTHFPCIHCTKMLINAGIKRIVYLNNYRVDENALLFLHEAGVQVDYRVLDFE
jgi:dCMP deaminase